jgi:hypothetical protein
MVAKYGQIAAYADAFMHSHYRRRGMPLIVFKKEELDMLKRILEFREIQIDRIEEQNDVRVSCQHYPYTCSEARFEHTRDWSDCSCKSASIKACKYFDTSKSYVEFSWDSEYMKHVDNCYDDCCCISNIFRRYAVYIL